MPKYWRGSGGLAVWVSGLALALAAQAQETHVAEELKSHSFCTPGCGNPDRQGRGLVRRQGEGPRVEARADGHHHLRHVEPALVSGGDAAGRRAGPGDEPDDRGGPRQGRLHHPRPQQLHGRLSKSPRPETSTSGPQGREPARAHRRVVQQDSGRREGDLSDRPVRRRLRRRAAVSPGIAVEVSGRRHRNQGRRRDQRLGRRDLEPAGKPRHHQRHAHGRSYQYVRARPAVRSAKPGPVRQERGPGTRPDRHDV